MLLVYGGTKHGEKQVKKYDTSTTSNPKQNNAREKCSNTYNVITMNDALVNSPTSFGGISRSIIRAYIQTVRGKVHGTLLRNFATLLIDTPSSL